MPGGAGALAPGGLGYPRGKPPRALGLGTGGPAPGPSGKMGSKMGSIFKEIYHWGIYIQRDRGSFHGQCQEDPGRPRVFLGLP